MSMRLSLWTSCRENQSISDTTMLVTVHEKTMPNAIAPATSMLIAPPILRRVVKSLFLIQFLRVDDQRHPR